MARLALFVCLALVTLTTCSAGAGGDGGDGDALAPSPLISPGPTQGRMLYEFLRNSGFLNYSTFLNLNQLDVMLDDLIDEGKSFTILAAGDDAFVARGDFPFPNFCKTVPNFDVDTANGKSTVGLSIINGKFDRRALRSQKVLTTLTPVPLTVLRSAGPIRLGVVNGLNKVVSSAYLDPEIYESDNIVVYGASDIIDYPQLAPLF